MKALNRDRLVIAVESLSFVLVLAILWLDEFVDIPYLYFGAPATPYRLAEYEIETVSIVAVAMLVVVSTLIIQRRSRRFEAYLRVCAWCKKVWLDGKWVPFEEYLEMKHEVKASHGICDECMKKEMAGVSGSNPTSNPPL
jgi:hypothetical protein